MANKSLLLEQYDTVLFNVNINPLGIPNSVKRAISENIEAIVKYPDIYYRNLKQAVSEYVSAPSENIVLGNGSSDLIRLFSALVAPKKALVLVPGPIEYERVLKNYGCEVDYYFLSEENEYTLDVVDFLSKLDSSYDMIILANPNNPTSKKIEADDIETIAEVCANFDIFLLIDEMYIEFLDDYKNYTSVPLTEKFENLAVIRSVSKFFAVPGIRFAYAVMKNPMYMQIIELTTTTNNIPTLSAVAGTVMFRDKGFIEESQSVIHTERNLVYAAMQTCKNVKLIKPDANFMLMKILKPDVTAKDLYEHCKLKGVIIRTCEDFYGLDDKYVRFCFMNPAQNDLMVNTILELM